MTYLLKFYVYTWKGTSADNQFLQGEIRAPNLHLAKSQLIYLNISVISIRKKILFFRLKNILKTQLRIQITEQLSDLLSSGLSMTRSLSTIKKIFPNPRIKTLLWLIHCCVESGQSLGNALDIYSNEFSAQYRQLVKIGETSGQLEKILSRLATLERKTLLIESKIKKASFYPCLVFSLSTLICWFLLIEITPKFIEIFDQTRVVLPSTTLALINLSKFLMSHGTTIIFIFTSFLLTGIYIFQTSVRIEKLLWRFFFSLPGIGKTLQAFYISQFSYSLSILLQTGVSLTKAVETFAKNIKNPFHREALIAVRHLLDEGHSLSHSLQSSFLFPDSMIYTLKIGEESGLMSESLLKIANFHECIIDQFLDTISIFLEPVLMIILGLVIGFFIIALYLPIFNLGNAI
jgi:type IV pilus assembly protein PilC